MKSRKRVIYILAIILGLALCAILLYLHYSGRDLWSFSKHARLRTYSESQGIYQDRVKDAEDALESGDAVDFEQDDGEAGDVDASIDTARTEEFRNSIGSVPFSMISNNADPDDERTVVCWGDSMTAGYHSTEGTIVRDGVAYNIDELSYPEMLESLTGLETYNFGLSGATSEEIAIMQGGLEPTKNPASYQTMDDKIMEEGEKHKGDILLLEIGSNGGWKDYDDLISQYKAMIQHAGCEDYIIIGDTDDPLNSADIETVKWATALNKQYIAAGGTIQNEDELHKVVSKVKKVSKKAERERIEEAYLGDTPWDAALREAFGEHFLSARTYELQNGLRLSNMVPTEQDKKDIAQGIIPLRLRSDWTHFSSYGYYVQAVAVYEKGVELGYWE